VFEIIDELPLVIFIDDLDRCSPSKIASVMEAINLFLAGELPKCMFVIGMDAEMVAAALEVAHKDVISKLPPYSSDTPIGWRFMDKFVQLPIILPPRRALDVMGYVESLLAKDREDLARHQQNKESIGSPEQYTKASLEKTEPVNTKQKEIQSQSNSSEEKKKIIEIADERIAHISDQDKEFQDIIKKTASDFSRNPRDIKRFMNMLRFQRFLRETMIAAADEKLLEGQSPVLDDQLVVPSTDQLSRWIVLSLKWPGVIRWLYSGSGVGEYNNKSWEPNIEPIQERLKLLEKLGRKYKSDNDWNNVVESELKLKVDSASWIINDGLWEFFQRETTYDEKERLSFSVGQGLY